MLAIFTVFIISSTMLIASVCWILYKRRITLKSYESLRSELLKTRISTLPMDYQSNFWSFIWRSMVIADNRKQMHQVLGNLCLVIAGIFPLISSGLEVLAPTEVGRPAGIVLNFFVSAASFLLSKFAFQTYEVGHGRACYLISAEIQTFLVGGNGYNAENGYRKFYETVREILDSDQTSFIGAGVTEGNPNALADFIRNNNLSAGSGGRPGLRLVLSILCCWL